MRRGRLRKLRAGTLLPWTQPPYGYRLDPGRPRDPAGVRLDEAEAALVRDLFAWYGDNDATLLGLRKRLLQLGIASSQGHRTWSSAALHGLLTNPTYTGQVFANRMRTVPARTRGSALRPVGRNGSSQRRTDPTEWIAVARVPALVDQAQFDRVQERLAYNRGMARRNNGVHAYLLRGLVSCGHCRRACGGRHLRPGYDYYVCPSKTQRRALVAQVRCRARHIPTRQLEDLVWRDLCQVLQHPQMIAGTMERAHGGEWQPKVLEGRRARLRRGLVALGEQRGGMTRAYGSGVIPLGEYERR